MEIGEVVMNNRFLLILLITVLVTGVLTATSFYIFDREKINLNITEIARNFSGNLEDWDTEYSDEWEKNLDLTHSSELGKIKEIRGNYINGALIIKKGPEKVEFYSKKMSSGNISPISYNDEILDINSEMIIDNSKLVIYTQEPDELTVTINEINGMLRIDEKLDKIDIGSVNGLLNINTEETFDIKVDSINGAANLTFDEVDAEFIIQNIYSLTRIFGEVSLVDGSKDFNFSKGDGSDKIEIKEVNGVLNID